MSTTCLSLLWLLNVVDGRFDIERNVSRGMSSAIKLKVTYWIVLKKLTVDQMNTIFDEIFVLFLFQSICNQRVSHMRRLSVEDVEIIRKPVFSRTHMLRSKSFLVRLVPVSSATRIIFIITPSLSAASYHDSTALIVFIERNTCLTCVLTCVGNILVTMFTLSTSVKFWTDKCITFDMVRVSTSLHFQDCKYGWWLWSLERQRQWHQRRWRY